MSANDDAMQSQGTGGAGMGPAAGAEMDTAQPDLHILDPEEQRAKMGLGALGAAMGQPPSEGTPAADDVARREQAAKLGETP